MAQKGRGFRDISRREVCLLLNRMELDAFSWIFFVLLKIRFKAHNHQVNIWLYKTRENIKMRLHGKNNTGGNQQCDQKLWNVEEYLVSIHLKHFMFAYLRVKWLFCMAQCTSYQCDAPALQSPRSSTACCPCSPLLLCVLRWHHSMLLLLPDQTPLSLLFVTQRRRICHNFSGWHFNKCIFLQHIFGKIYRQHECVCVFDSLGCVQIETRLYCVLRCVSDRVSRPRQVCPAHLRWHPARRRCPRPRPLCPGYRLRGETPHCGPVTHSLVELPAFSFDWTRLTDLQRRVDLVKERWFNIFVLVVTCNIQKSSED